MTKMTTSGIRLYGADGIKVSTPENDDERRSGDGTNDICRWTNTLVMDSSKNRAFVVRAR